MMQQSKMKMRSQKKRPWEVKDMHTETMKMNTQNATTTPANTTQKMNQSIIKMIYQVSWTNNMVRGIGKSFGLGNENGTPHQRCE